ncbi:MAG: hypothetical protein HC896_15875 [Bacteroidales bacterium]|nr:hypothetical protein [Bacteroidales bacterium]
MSKESTMPTLFEMFFDVFLKNIFEDELDSNYTKFIEVSKLPKVALNNFLYDTCSLWWDNTRTPGRESRKNIVALSFQQAVKELSLATGKGKPNWEAQHLLWLEHPLGKIKVLKQTLSF